MKIASEINPNVLAAALLEEASVHQIEVAKGDLLPTVSLQAQGVVTDDWEGTGAETESFSISGVVSVPLYDGGRTYSTVRQAKHQASEKRIQVIEANRAVREAVQVAWSSLAAARQTITAAKQQVSAANQALDGVKQENEAGTRTTLDVLNAQSEVFEARITQVNAEHDAVVGAFQLLAAMGQLTADHLNLPVAAYDAAENYQRVEKKWFGTDAEVVE
jgi:outer membrane protein TolC